MGPRLRPAIALAAFSAVALPAVRAHADAQPWLVWHTADFFTTCDGNCGVAIYAGREILSPMTNVFLVHNPIGPWEWQYGAAGIAAGALSRRFATLFDALDLEAELGLGQRFGDMHATETWVAIDVRWTGFPWNDYVRTTVALAEGIAGADRIDPEERIQSGNNRASNVLNYFSPEVTFALPSAPDDELLFRFHHRSGAFGLIHGVTAASQFTTVGYRHRF